jgi:hypothetical protein
MRRLAAQQAALESKTFESLEELCSSIRTLTLTSKLEPIVKDYYQKYNFKDIHYKFNESHFRSLMVQNQTIVDKILDFMQMAYKQFQYNPDLLFQHLEHENSYKNFDINLIKALPLFSLSNIARFLDILYKESVLFDEQVSRHTGKESFLKSVISSSKIDAVDLIVLERWKSMSAIEFGQYVFIVGKMAFKESLVVKQLIQILDSKLFDFRKDFGALMLLILGLGFLQPEDRFLFIHLENAVVNGPFASKTFYETYPQKSIMAILLTFDQNFSTKRLWSRLDEGFFEFIRPDFKEALMITKQKVLFDCATKYDLDYISEAPEFKNSGDWFHLLDWKEMIPVTHTFFAVLGSRLRFPEPVFKKWMVAFFEYMDLNKNTINELPVHSRFQLLCFYFLLYEQVFKYSEAKYRKYFEDNWGNFRLILNNMFRGADRMPTIYIMDLYLVIGRVKQTTKSDADFLSFFRRKLYHSLIRNLPYDDPLTILKVYQKAIVSNYLFDDIFNDLVEFCLLKFFDKYSFAERAVVSTLHVGFLQSVDFKQLSSEELAKRKDFAMFVLLDALRQLHDLSDSLKTIDRRLITDLSKSAILIIDKLKSVDEKSASQLQSAYDRTFRTIKEVIELADALEAKSLISFTHSHDETLIGFYTLSEIIDKASTVNANPENQKAIVQLDHRHLIKMHRYHWNSLLYGLNDYAPGIEDSGESPEEEEEKNGNGSDGKTNESANGN